MSNRFLDMGFRYCSLPTRRPYDMYRGQDPIAETTRATLRGLEPAMTNELTRRRLLSAGAAASVAALPAPARPPALPTRLRFRSASSMRFWASGGSDSKPLYRVARAHPQAPFRSSRS